MQTLRLTSSADCVEALPLLLGYVPEERLSVVALVGGRVAMTASLPLAGVDSLWRGAIEAVRRSGADGVVLYVHSADELAVGVLNTIELELTLDGFSVRDSLLCLPTEWESMVYLDGRHPYRENEPVTLSAIVAGMPLPQTRDALVARWNPIPERVAQRHARDKGNGQSPMNGARAAELAAAVTPQFLTEQLMTLTGKTAAEALALWSEVITYIDTTEAESAPVALMVGIAGWLSGDGLACGTMLDRCSELEVGPELAAIRDLLEDALEYGASPASWFEHRDR